MSAAVLGLDIGGANLKAAHTDGRALSVPFALWKNPGALAGRPPPAAARNAPGRHAGRHHDWRTVRLLREQTAGRVRHPRCRERWRPARRRCASGATTVDSWTWRRPARRPASGGSELAGPGDFRRAVCYLRDRLAPGRRLDHHGHRAAARRPANPAGTHRPGASALSASWFTRACDGRRYAPYWAAKPRPNCSPRRWTFISFWSACRSGPRIATPRTDGPPRRPSPTLAWPVCSAPIWKPAPKRSAWNWPNESCRARCD